MIDNTQLRAALRMERIRAGYTLDALAAKTGLNRATLHSIENTKRQPHLRPEFGTVVRIIDALGFSVSEFFLMLERAEGGARTAQTPKQIPTAESDVVVTAARELAKSIEAGAAALLLALGSKDKAEVQHFRVLGRPA